MINNLYILVDRKQKFDNKIIQWGQNKQNNW